MTADQQHKNDPYFGHMASIILALLVCGWIANTLMLPLSGWISEISAANWRTNVGAGIFFGISLANPVGTFLAKSSWKKLFLRAGFGLVFGVAAQILFLTPLVGAAMSHFIQLLMAGLMIPLGHLVTRLRLYAHSKSIHPSDKIAKTVLRVTRWPDRFLFILLMGCSFAAFWQLAEFKQVLIALAVVLTLLTGAIAFRTYDGPDGKAGPEADFQEWLALQPEESVDKSIISQATEEARMVVRTLVPGAILFGGMTRLAVDVLLMIYPNIQSNLANPDEMFRTFGIIAASGLGVVLFGMFAALMFSLTLLQIIARIRKWTVLHHRESCFRLLRTMYFRPMKRT